MVEWIPIQVYASAGLASLGDNSEASLDLWTGLDPVSSDTIGPCTVVGGWVDIYVYTADASAVTAGRGPLEGHLYLKPTGVTGVSFLTPALAKKAEELAWMKTEAFVDNQVGLLRMRFDLNTKRSLHRDECLTIIYANHTGAALSANTKLTVVGELYIVPE